MDAALAALLAPVAALEAFDAALAALVAVVAALAALDAADAALVAEFAALVAVVAVWDAFDAAVAALAAFDAAFAAFATLVAAPDAFVAALAAPRAVEKRVAPEYPVLAIRMRIGGVVTVTATVAADGRVTAAKAEHGNSLLAPAAVAAVRKWKFAPATDVSTETVNVTFDMGS